MHFNSLNVTIKNFHARYNARVLEDIVFTEEDDLLKDKVMADNNS